MEVDASKISWSIVENRNSILKVFSSNSLISKKTKITSFRVLPYNPNSALSLIQTIGMVFSKPIVGKRVD